MPEKTDKPEQILPETLYPEFIAWREGPTHIPGPALQRWLDESGYKRGDKPSGRVVEGGLREYMEAGGLKPVYDETTGLHIAWAAGEPSLTVHPDVIPLLVEWLMILSDQYWFDAAVEIEIRQKNFLNALTAFNEREVDKETSDSV